MLTAAEIVTVLVTMLVGTPARPQQLLILNCLPIIFAMAAGCSLLYVGLVWHDDCSRTSDEGSAFQLFYVTCAAPSGFFLLLSLSNIGFWCARRSELLKMLEAVEGSLPHELEHGTIRLLRVEWLLAQPEDWRLKRRQDLERDFPDDGKNPAFFPPAEAVRLLRKGKVSCLSYRWLHPITNDPDGFTLKIVRKYFEEENRGRHTAIMIDFACIPQIDPETVNKEIDPETGKETCPFGKRTDPEDQMKFNAAMAVMSNMYASPRVLILQQKRMPEKLEEELYLKYNGDPPDPKDHPDGLDLRPYAGKHCRSGWCTSELALTLLMTWNGGHAYELGVGKVPVPQKPSVEEMERLFSHKSTRFGNPSDSEMVITGYNRLREKVEELDRDGHKCARDGDEVLTSDTCDAGMVWVMSVLGLLGFVIFLVGILVALLVTGKTHVGAAIGFLSWAAVTAVCWFKLCFSGILRAHFVAVLCCRSRKALPYTFHWGVPPFRKKPAELVPDCFLGPLDKKEGLAVAVTEVVLQVGRG